MKPLVLVCFAFVLCAQTDQKTNTQNMVRDRGQTRVPNSSQVMTRGRLGTQSGPPVAETTVTGILIDASCEDRSALNLRSQPESLAAELPAQPPNALQGNPPRQGAVSAHGITVDARTIAREHADIAPHQVPDMLTRQEDPTCAITAATRGYAMFTRTGRLLNLDEGGNTFASAAVLANPRGRAMLNGQAPGVKPRAEIKGWILGDRLIVDSILQMQ